MVADSPLRFICFGIAANGHVDAQQQRIAAATLDPGDVIVGVSNTGTSGDVVTATGIARSNGARSNAITAPVVEDTNMHFPSYSRIPHLMIMDFIATAVGLRRGQAAIENVRRKKAALGLKWTFPHELSRT